MQIILTADEQLYDYHTSGKLYGAGKAPKGTVFSVSKMSTLYEIGDEGNRKESVYRIAESVPGIAQKGDFLRWSSLTSKVYEPPKVGEKLATQNVYTRKDGVPVHASMDASSKVLKKLKKDVALTANRIAGTDWFAAEGGYVPFGDGKNLTSIAPTKPEKKPTPKPTSTPSFGLAQSQPAATVVAAAPAPAGMSTTTIIAIGLIGVAALLFLLPKGKG